MSRIRIVRGKIIKRTGGNHSVYAGSHIVRVASGHIRDRGINKGVRYQILEKPVLPSLIKIQ